VPVKVETGSAGLFDRREVEANPATKLTDAS